MSCDTVMCKREPNGRGEMRAFSGLLLSSKLMGGGCRIDTGGAAASSGSGFCSMADSVQTFCDWTGLI
jgi:hypothetical protein